MKDEIERLRELREKATPGPWEVQDGCSWRRIGAGGKDGNVLYPTNCRHDGHPDLSSGRGEDRAANLDLIVAAVNALPKLLDVAEIAREALTHCVEPGYLPSIGKPLTDKLRAALSALGGKDNG